MNVVIPAGAKSYESKHVPNRTIVKIDGMCGWDIAEVVAIESCMSVKQLTVVADIGVYGDHIMIDTSSICH